MGAFIDFCKTLMRFKGNLPPKPVNVKQDPVEFPITLCHFSEARVRNQKATGKKLKFLRSCGWYLIIRLLRSKSPSFHRYIVTIIITITFTIIFTINITIIFTIIITIIFTIIITTMFITTITIPSTPSSL